MALVVKNPLANADKIPWDNVEKVVFGVICSYFHISPLSMFYLFFGIILFLYHIASS